MNTVKVPPSLLNVTDKHLITEAIYYIVRVLRNAIRNYPNTPVSSEPSPDARRLAQLAVDEIENFENTKISDLSKDRLVKYNNRLEEFLIQTYQSNIGTDTNRAEAILEEMRASN